MATTEPLPARKRSPVARRDSLGIRVRRAVRNHLDVPRAARHSLNWDLIAGACAGAYQGMTFPFFVRIARGELGASETLVALMTAAPFVGNLLSPVWARQMEGRAKMPFCLLSWISARFLLLLMPLAATGSAFVGIVFLLQFIGTVGSPAYTSLMKDIYPDRARGRLIGYVRVGVQSLMFVATLCAGRLLDHNVSYRVLFPIAGLLGIGAALSFARVRPLDPGPVLKEGRALSAREFTLDTLSILRDNIAYRWFALSVFTYGFGNLMVQPLYQLYQVDVLRISNTQIANLANFASLMAIVGAFFWGRFIDRHGAPRTVLLSILLITLIPLVYLSARSVPWLFFASALSGFGFAGIELSYLTSILAYAEPGRAAQYQSLHSLLLGVRGVLAPLIGVPLMHALGYHGVFWLALVIMIVGAYVQWLATRRDDQRPRDVRPA